MATTPMHLTVLYQEALEAVTATPENWLAFLQSAGRNYRYPFQDQLLIHHQRPNAVAVLTYAQWEQRFGRRARRGSTGIAVFGRSRGRTQVQYYFDVQDTYPTPNARPVPLWSVEPGDSGLLLKLLTEKFSVTAPVLPIAIFEVSKTYTSAVISANWEVLQDAEIPVPQDAFQQLVENSVSYLLLHRLGMEDYARFYPTDFDALEQFRTPETVHLLGDTVNAASRDILTEIAATIRAVHLYGAEFFAESQTSVYDENMTEQNEPEKGGQNHGDDIQSGKRHETAELDDPGGTGGDGQVRNAAGDFSPGTPAQPVSGPDDQRDAEPAPDGGPAPGVANVGGPDAPASAGDGRDRSAEGQRSHDLGGADEQSQAQRRRDDPGGAGVQLSIDEPEPSVEAPGSFSVPEQEAHQLSMFDAADVVIMDTEENKLSFLHGPEYSQAVIDEALRIGANNAHSRLIICAYFMKDKPQEENVRFLQNHYGTNGAGFYYENQQYAIWYDTDGIQLAAGNTVRSRMSMTISWDTAAERIRELLDEGRYLSQEELDNVSAFELNTLSNEFALAARDLSQEARDLGLTPTIIEAVTPGVFPESADKISALISDPKSLQTIIDEWTNVVEADAQSHEVFRWRVPAQRFLDRLQDMQIQPLTFYAAEGFNPQHQLFISNDEIDNVLRRGTTDYRLTVYSFYQLHADRKARENFLKDQHGAYSGSHGGNDNLTYTPNKGISFSHGSITAPYAEVQLSWSKAAKRIGELIQRDQFLLPADRAAMQTVSIEANETVLAPDENEILQESIRLINKYCQSVFESDGDFEDLSHVDLAFSATSDSAHTVEVSADLENFRIVYQVDGQTVFTTDCDSLSELNEYLANLDFDAMVANAEEHFFGAHRAALTPEEVPEETPRSVIDEESDRIDEMLQQAELAAKLSEETGQNVFAFEEGNPQPVEFSPETVAVYPAEENHMEDSHCYNPFRYIESDNDAQRLVTNLFKATTPKNSTNSDPFWDNAAQMLLMALVLYLHHEAPPEEQNFSMVMEMLQAGEVKEEDENYQSPLDILFYLLSVRTPNHIALKYYNSYRSGAGKTLKSIQITLMARLEKFNLESLAALTITDELDLPSLGEKKVALFAQTPDNDGSFNFIVSILYTQLFQQLFSLADRKYGGALPVHVHFLMDEFANVSLPDDFEKILSVMRSREVSASIILQNMAQLKALFSKQWESIVGNCDSFLFLGGNEKETHKYESKTEEAKRH